MDRANRSQKRQSQTRKDFAPNPTFENAKGGCGVGGIVVAVYEFDPKTPRDARLVQRVDVDVPCKFDVVIDLSTVKLPVNADGELDETSHIHFINPYQLEFGPVGFVEDKIDDPKFVSDPARAKFAAEQPPTTRILTHGEIFTIMAKFHKAAVQEGSKIFIPSFDLRNVVQTIVSGEGDSKITTYEPKSFFGASGFSMVSNPPIPINDHNRFSFWLSLANRTLTPTIPAPLQRKGFPISYARCIIPLGVTMMDDKDTDLNEINETAPAYTRIDNVFFGTDPTVPYYTDKTVARSQQGAKDPWLRADLQINGVSRIPENGEIYDVAGKVSLWTDALAQICNTTSRQCIDDLMQWLWPYLQCVALMVTDESETKKCAYNTDPAGPDQNPFRYGFAGKVEAVATNLSELLPEMGLPINTTLYDTIKGANGNYSWKSIPDDVEDAGKLLNKLKKGNAFFANLVVNNTDSDSISRGRKLYLVLNPMERDRIIDTLKTQLPADDFEVEPIANPGKNRFRYKIKKINPTALYYEKLEAILVGGTVGNCILHMWSVAPMPTYPYVKYPYTAPSNDEIRLVDTKLKELYQTSRKRHATFAMTSTTGERSPKRTRTVPETGEEIDPSQPNSNPAPAPAPTDVPIADDPSESRMMDVDTTLPPPPPIVEDIVDGELIFEETVV
jgi:hypothetical protein